MSLYYAVLGVLEARPMTGYELTRFLESSAAWVWSAPQSQIYPLLRRLDEAGLIEGEEQVRGERMRRTMYRLTDDGRADLCAWTAASHPAATGRDAFLLQALFLDLVETADAVDVLRARAHESRAQAEGWAVHAARLRALDTPLLIERLKGRDPSDHAWIADSKAQVFDLLARQAQLRADWAGDLADALEAERPRWRA